MLSPSLPNIAAGGTAMFSREGPKPVRIGQKRLVWLKKDLDKWLDGLAGKLIAEVRAPVYVPGNADAELVRKNKEQDARIETLQSVIQELIDVALPSNWDNDDDPDHVAAWTAAMVSMGIDPETMKVGSDG
jgi:hypothetical protein